tara:strand:+ start:173 stop:319 length:147 start_codon:yes stop_codon:yes gene_type:complete
MRNFLATEIINGVLTVVEYIKYSNGEEVKRIYDTNGNICDIIKDNDND